MKIALITPKFKEDYLTNTVIDGLLDCEQSVDLGSKESFTVRYSSLYKTYLPVKDWFLERSSFIEYAKAADLILFFWGKNNTDFELAEEVGVWNKTIFIDGSELGKNNRLDPDINKKVIDGTYNGMGAIDFQMLKKAALYFRREKPYLENIIPLPFGIERRYRKNYSAQKKKDIDVVCIFGQEQYPPLRAQVRNHVLSTMSDMVRVTKPTNKRLFWTMSDMVAREKFYELLSRAKAGISVSGGGYDTARFWEILGNNCILLTEKIDIFRPEDAILDYKRIWQFEGFEDFKVKYQQLEDFLKDGYEQKMMDEEYEKVIKEHSTKARVQTIIDAAVKRGMI